MAEEQKPAATETPAVDPTPAATEPAAEAAPAATTETPAEAPAEEIAATPAEEKITKTEKPVEPIHFGALGYKAPGLVNSLRFSKKYFWFGDEPVSTQSLSHYLRGEKPEVAHPAAAWSSQTGKGLLYFVKHADQKATPAGVLNLAEATDLTKDGTIAFYFKLHGHKHTFETTSAPERNGWFMAAEKIIAEAKAAREEILASAGYKEQLEKLSKPAGLAVAGASVAKEGSTPKKSTEVKPTESAAPARTGSSSSEDAEGKKKSKSKSRSLSRKRGSIFGSLLGKKEEKAEEKKEEKKEEEAAAPAADAEPSAEPTEEATAAVAAAPVPTLEGPSDEAKPAETTETAETTEPAAEAAETPKAAPKPTKRGSIFGSLASKLRSPTTEKKEADIVPPVPAKDEPATETPAEAPKIEENPAETTETPAEAPKETTEEASKEEASATTPTATLKSKRGSIFGNFTGSVKKEKSDGEGEAKTNKLTGLFRNASKAGKSKDVKKKDATTPPKVEEAAEPATTETPAKEAEAAPAAEPTPAAEPNSIGDVVPAAVTVGQAPKSTPEVSAAA